MSRLFNCESTSSTALTRFSRMLRTQLLSSSQRDTENGKLLLLLRDCDGITDFDKLVTVFVTNRLDRDNVRQVILNILLLLNDVVLSDLQFGSSDVDFFGCLIKIIDKIS